MLQIILGKSGSGKTATAVNIASELVKKGETKLLMLVPDQNSFETESSFLNILGAGLCRNVFVFGFNRLCDYVFINTGNIPQNVIDDGVRKIIISKALDECSDKLSFFSSAKTRKSVLDIMLHSLKEWKKDGITADMINSVCACLQNETLKRKLDETSLVLEAYDAILSGTYIDPLDNLNRLAAILDNCDLFSGYTVIVDSFSGFTRQQLEVLSCLMRCSKDFYITLNIDSDDMNSDVFSTTKRTYKQIKRLSAKNDIKVLPDIVLPSRLRSDNDEFTFLEKNIFRINDEVYSKPAPNIETFLASDIYGEAGFIFRKIKSLVIDGGYNYSDIAVVCRDISLYSGILDAVFDKYGIPYFMNIPKDIYNTPIIRFVSSAIDFITSGFERERLLSMLKTGLLVLSDVEIADFENYLITWNINRSALKSEFAFNPSGLEKLTASDEKKLAQIEHTRRFVIEPLIELKNSCKNATVLDISKSVYKLFEAFNIENMVDKLYDSFTAQNMLCEADELVRVYNLFTEALDKITAAAGDDKITLKKYKEYFDYLISDIKFSDIPAYQNQVNVGVADRIRLSNAKVVFVIGAVDGVFPSVPKTAGAFSETERKILIENNIPLSDCLEDLAAHEKYLAYCALTSPVDKLFVTAFTGDFTGEACMPSELYNEVERLFPNRVHSTSMDVNELAELYDEQQAFEYLAKRFTDNSPEVSELKNYFTALDSYNLNLDKIENVINKKPFRINSRSVCENLFGKKINISASRLEKYNLCAFQYFCNYGLNAKERSVASIDAIQIGNVVHYFLEKFLKKYNKSVLNTLSDADIHNSINEILGCYAEEYYGGLSGKPESFSYIFERLKVSIFALTKHLIKQLCAGDFVPVDFELQIGRGGDIPEYTVKIDSEHSVSVNGFIDRVDISKKSDDEYYVRIVDYKTGQKTFKLYDILYGINMQMLIYLRAVQKNGGKYYNKHLIPSAILYMPAFAPVIKSDENDIEKKFNDKMRMNGLVLNDADVLRRMDNKGDYIKISKKLIDDKFSETLADNEQFNQIFKHIDYTLRVMGQSLLEGNVEARPIKGVENGCAYCPYDSVCLRKYGDSYRYASEANAKEVYQALEGEVK